MILVLIKKELLEIVRTYKLLIMVLVFLFIGLMSPFSAKMMPKLIKLMMGSMPGVMVQIPEPKLIDSYLQFHKNLYQIGIITIILIAMGSLINEKNTKSLIMVLTKPVSRAAFLSAKFIALAILCFGAFLIAYCGCELYTYLLFQYSYWLHSAFILLIVFADYLFLLSAIFFFSSLTANLMVCVSASFGVYLVTSVIGFLSQTQGYIVPGHNSGTVYYVLMGGTTYTEALSTIGVTMLATFLLLGLSIYFFRKEEL